MNIIIHDFCLSAFAVPITAKNGRRANLSDGTKGHPGLWKRETFPDSSSLAPFLSPLARDEETNVIENPVQNRHSICFLKLI